MAKNKVQCIANQNFYSDNPYILNDNKGKLKDIVGYTLLVKDLNDKEQYNLISLSVSSNQDPLKKDPNEAVFQLCTIQDKKQPSEKHYYVKTGLYTGVLYVGNLAFHIGTGYNAGGEEFLLRRMLRYANNIFVENDDQGSADDEFKNGGFPLFEYLFLTSLQKATILGFPQEYTKSKYHELKVHGNVDVGRYIVHDIPFKGKIASVKNERKYVQCIIDVLYFALKTVHDEIRREHFSRLSFVKSELQASYSGRRPNAETISQALNHRALNNPMFAEFKKTLKYAAIVLRKHDMMETENENSMGINGYLMDVSSLWESYLASLLRNAFPDWNIKTQEELSLYEGSFFARHNYPDLVMEKDGEYVILDAKFKQMRLDNRYDDVDRSDLFQINSYAGFYNLKFPGKVKLCGLIYPLSKNMDEEHQKQAHLAHLYGLSDGETNNQTKFIIDGIYVGPKTVPGKQLYESSNEDEQDVKNKINLLESEAAFVARIQSLIDS